MRILILPLALLACSDPVQEQRLDALGPEHPSVPLGELHRPGQPCLVCHGELGPAESVFTLAGTVYQTPFDAKPAKGVVVRFIDFTGLQYETKTNRAGSFYVDADQFDPAWPIWVRLQADQLVVDMASAIQREGSCGQCHAEPRDPSHVGRIYLQDATAEAQ